jgi:hypothetical protein
MIYLLDRFQKHTPGGYQEAGNQSAKLRQAMLQSQEGRFLLSFFTGVEIAFVS